MRRGEISFAERLECVVRLKPDSEACELLRKALHVIDVDVRVPSPRMVPPLKLPPEPSLRPSASEVPGNPSLAPSSPTPESRPFELRALPRDEDEGFPWPWESEPELPPESTDRKIPLLEFLLAPLARTAILTSALSTRAHEGALDVPKAVETLAQARPLKCLPRLPVPTLRRGIQLLVDVGEGMLPFAMDRAALVEAIHRLSPQVDLKMFLGCPSRGAGSGARLKKGWPRWRPPARGTVIVLLSNLALGGPRLSFERALPAEWLAFAEKARRAGCPVVAFVPYERRRWPRSLARAMVLVPWDRGTTAGLVRRAVGPGHEVEP